MLDLKPVINPHQTMMQIPSSPVQSPPLTYPSGLDIKFVLPQYSSPFNSEETYPETYSLDCSAQSTDSKPAMTNYLCHDSSMYRTQPYTKHSIRSAANTLLERPQRTQLPLPQPSPAQTSRNVVDQLQDQRLRSGQAIGGSSLSNGGFVKPPLSFASALLAQNNTSVPASTTDTAPPPAYSNFRDSQE
jgi:hypothetical protein